MRTFKFNSGNLDEITFEHRNKEYGAYELRKSYNSRLIKSFFTTMALIAFAFGGGMLINELFKKEVLPIVVPDGTIFVDNSLVVDPPENPKPIIHPPDPPRQNAIADAPFRIEDDSLLTDLKKDSAVSQTDQSIASANQGSGISNDTSTTIASATGNSGSEAGNVIASAEPYHAAAVDKAPQFPGGEDELIKFLQRNIHFNERAQSAGINGRVYASFIVNSKGEVEGIKIIRSLGYGLDDEVIRVLHSMPKWEPGYYHGIAVSTIMNLPVAFTRVK